MQDINHMINRMRTLHSDELREQGLRWLSIRILREYICNIWSTLYAMQFEFRSKDIERSRQIAELKEEWIEIDEEFDKRSIKKRKLDGLNQSKGICKQFVDPPSLTYRSVKKELQENPISAWRGRDYLDRRSIFCLLFLEFVENSKELKTNWNQPYLLTLKIIKDKLISDEFDQFVQYLYNDFKRYCLCIPAVSKARWINKSIYDKSRPAWIGFICDCGLRTENPLNRTLNTTWKKETNIQNDIRWKMTYEEAIKSRW